MGVWEPLEYLSLFPILEQAIPTDPSLGVAGPGHTYDKNIETLFPTIP